MTTSLTDESVSCFFRRLYFPSCHDPECMPAYDLQQQHKCYKCGYCCSIGGNMNITADEVRQISEYLGCGPNDLSRLPIQPSPSVPGQYMFSHNQPCFFLDKATRECLIYPVRPQACRDYPFMLLCKRGCLLADVILCPSAHDTLIIRLCGARPSIPVDTESD